MKANFINGVLIGRSIVVTIVVLARRLIAVARSALFATISTCVIGLFFATRLTWIIVSNS